MFIFLCLGLSLLALPMLYPLGVWRWLVRLDAYLEERHQRRVAQYLHEVHEHIAYMKRHVQQSAIDAPSKVRLQQMCDDYEYALRVEALSEAEE